MCSKFSSTFRITGDAVEVGRGAGVSGRRQKSESVFSVFHYNVQCLRNKAHQIEAFLFDKNYDILCINEHWLSNDEIKCINICKLEAGYY